MARKFVSVFKRSGAEKAEDHDLPQEGGSERTKLEADNRATQGLKSEDAVSASSSTPFDPIIDPKLPKGWTITKIGFGSYLDQKGILTFSPNNVLLNSNAFSQTSWQKINCEVMQLSTPSPVVGEASWRLSERDDDEGAHYIYGKSYSIINSHIIISLFAKKMERDSLVLEISNFKTGSAGCRFNLTSGAVEPPSSTTDDYQDLAASIEEFPHGWFRCSLRVKKAKDTNENYLTISLDHNGNNFYKGDGKSGLLISCAQMEIVTYQLYPGEYLNTQVQPAFGLRFDYEAVSKKMRGLVIEGASENQLALSESFSKNEESGAGWRLDGLARVATNKLSPSGEAIASAFISQKDCGSIIYAQACDTFDVRTMSCWFRSDEGPINVEYTLDGGDYWRPFEISHHWRRYIWQLPEARHQIGFRLQKANHSMEMWGAQLEAGTCATSYIPAERGISIRAEDSLVVINSELSSIDLNILDLQTQKNGVYTYKIGKEIEKKNIVIKGWKGVSR